MPENIALANSIFCFCSRPGLFPDELSFKLIFRYGCVVEHYLLLPARMLAMFFDIHHLIPLAQRKTS